MVHAPIILADDSSGVKILGAVIFLIIWGIGALSSVVKKANEANKKKPVVPRPAAILPPLPLPARPAKKAAIPARRPQQARAQSPFMPRAQVAMPPTMAQRAAALTHMVHTAQEPPRPAPPPMPTVARRPVESAPAKSVSASSQVTRSSVRAAGANASSIRRWLRPDSLRKQFILTELLQPSLALREPRE